MIKANEEYEELILNKEFRYLASKDLYYSTSHKKLVGVIIGEVEQLAYYYTHEYKKIYPDFNYKTQVMTVNTYSQGLIFIVSEIEIDKKITPPKGLYKIGHDSEYGYFLRDMRPELDKYVSFREDGLQMIQKDVQSFIDSKDEFKEDRNKSSSLLYGPPGNGKTREIIKVLENLENDNITGIYIPSDIRDITFLADWKALFKDHIVVFVIEELTNRTNEQHQVEDILSFLDGETSWNNAYTIITTNHPERLAQNLLNRPGRFSNFIKFDSPTLSEKVNFLRGKKLSLEDAEELAEESRDLSLDYLVESLRKSIRSKRKPVEHLKEMRDQRKFIVDEFKLTIGINGK